MKYDIMISRGEWDEIYNESNIKDGVRLTTSKYCHIFKKHMVTIEKKEFNIHSRIGRIHENSTRSTNYFTANGFCSVCKIVYKFTIPEKVIDDTNYIRIIVMTDAEHDISLHEQVSTKPMQIRGEKRTDEAKKIILESGGSSKDHRLKTISNEAKNIHESEDWIDTLPSEDTYRRIKHEYRQKDVRKDLNWIENLHDISDIYSQTVKPFNDHKDSVRGYLQEFMTNKEFTMYLHIAKQIECIHAVPEGCRIWHVDATGGLVQIASALRNYPKLLNYVTLLKDSRLIGGDFTTASTITSEMVTSRQDSYRITDFFNYFKTNYESRYKNNHLNFRLICTDFSYALMYGILNSIMNETLIKYSHRVYKLSKDEIFIEDGFSWLYSCTSHTMKRFSNSLKKLTTEKRLRSISCYAFSLLLNSQSLTEICEYFKIICVVFLSKVKDEEWSKHFDLLQKCVSLRPKRKDELLQLLEKDDETEFLFVDENNLFETIKEGSPFTQHFEKIYEETIDNLIECKTIDKNPLILHEFIQLLLNQYMPYCFLWSGFVLKNLCDDDDDNIITRWNNGACEKIFGRRKFKGKDFKNVNPRQFVVETYSLIDGMCEEFMHIQKKNNFKCQNVLKKPTNTFQSSKNININALDKDFQKHSHINDIIENVINDTSAVEINKGESVETWSKKGDRIPSLGHTRDYQKPYTFDLNTWDEDVAMEKTEKNILKINSNSNNSKSIIITNFIHFQLFYTFIFLKVTYYKTPKSKINITNSFLQKIQNKDGNYIEKYLILI